MSRLQTDLEAVLSSHTSGQLMLDEAVRLRGSMYNSSMLEGSGITTVEAAGFLKGKYGGGVTDVEAIGEGGWSVAFAFVHDGVKKVIRWSDMADNFERDAVAVRFTGIDLPVPPIIEIGRGLDRFFAISPYIDGTYLETLDMPELENTLPSLFRMLRALRAIHLAGTSGFGFWNRDGKGSHDSWKSFLLDDKNEAEGSLINGWKAQLEASSMGMDAYHKLWGTFERLVERCPEERSLIHADLLNRNVLARSGSIAAVLDWGSSIYGDALYDVAWFTFYEPWYPEFQELHVSQRLLEDFQADPHTNKVDIEARLKCYQLDIGIGSIAYNAFKQNWENAEEAADYTMKLLSGFTD